MVRFFQILDDVCSQIVPLCYTLGALSGTLAYFSGATIPGATLAVGILLSIAVELHLFLCQRRCRQAYALLSHMAQDDPGRKAAVRQFRVQIGTLILLGAFSAWNGANFLAGAWRPTDGAIPAWIQVGIRSAIVPLLILLSGALVPVAEDTSAILSRTAAKILRQTMRDVADQMHQQVREAKEQGASLSPLVTALLVDAGDPRGARRIRTIHEGLQESRGEAVPTLNSLESDKPISLATARRSKKRKRAGTRDPEGTVKRLLSANPKLPLSQIMRAGISMSEAAKWRRIVLAEMGEQQHQQQEA